MSVESFFYPASDGLRLHARIHGAQRSDRLPVVCLPGLTRNARDFDGLAQFLLQGTEPRRVIAFDYRGRGLSEADPDWRNYNFAVEADDILAGLAALGIWQAQFVGTSRGGLILHLLAGARPGLLQAAVLNDIGPELGREGLLQIRSYLTQPRFPADFAEAVAIQRQIHGAAFPALSDADWERLAAAIYRVSGGRPMPDFDPALTNMVAAIDLEKPLPDLWPQFEALRAIPLLTIRGEHSRLLTPETLTEMQRRHPAMQAFVAEGQGHAPLLEIGGLPQRIAAFLDRSEKADPP